MKYFYNISNLQELKKAYRENVVRFHPDRNGGTTTAQFQEMQNEYEKAQRIISEGGKIGPQTQDADTSAQNARYSRSQSSRSHTSSSSSSQRQTKTAEQRERERKEREAQWRARHAEAEQKARTEFEAKDRCMKEAAKSDADCIKWAKILKPIYHYCYYSSDGKDSAKQKANIRANVQRMARHFFRGVTFNFCGSGWSPRLSWEDGPSAWEMEKHREDFDLFRGRTWHAAGVSEDYGHSEPRKGGETFRYMYGSIDDGLRFERKFSADTRLKVVLIIQRLFPQFQTEKEANFSLSDLDTLYHYMQIDEGKLKMASGTYLVDRMIHIDSIVRFFAKFWTYDIESDYVRATTDTEANKKAQAFADAFAESMNTAKQTAEAFAEAIKTVNNNKKENNNNNQNTINMETSKNNNSSSFFANVTNLADLTAQFQNLALQFITDPEKMNALRIEYLRMKDELSKASEAPQNEAPQQEAPKTEEKTVEPWLSIVDYSEKSFVVTGFGEPEDLDKGHQYKYIQRYFLARFEKVAPKRCSVNVNLRDGLRGIVISKKSLDDVQKLVDKMNKKERPQYDANFGKKEEKAA